MKRIKIYNLFIFLSTLARSLIDCFIPIILYNKGLEVKYIISFLLLNYSLGFILNVPLGFIGRKITFKWLLIITSFLIGLSYYYLLMVKLDVTNLFLFTLFHVASTQAYWLSRHYYALEVLPKHNLADDAGNIVVFSTLALIPISYVGALLINNIDIEQVLIIIVFLYMISVIPLFKITEKKKDINRELITTSHNIVLNIPRKSLWFMFIAQFRMVSRYLFPLFLYIYVHQNYEYIGVFNIAVSVASIFFIYFFSKRMDKEKKDYLLLSGVLFCIVYFLKLNIVDTGLMLLVGLFEGIVDKMYDVAFDRNLYALGHHYDGLGYTIVMEGLQNISRVVIVMIFFFFISSLKNMLYLAGFMFIIGGLIGFDDGKGGY
ncbi:MAG: hypothetical protein PHS98_04470 [Bacilli bacterium]|nr:hypothetical protein [Bacilli bacterium]